MPRRREQIEALLADADRIEERLASWQSAEARPDNSEIRTGAREYTSWYARALRSVPDDQAETFKDMYEGGSFVTRIRGFLSDPLELSAMWDPDSPSPLIPKFQRPFKSDFKENLDRQRAILIIAMDAEVGIVNLLDDLAALFTRLPDYLAVLESRSTESVPAPSIKNEADLQIVVEAILRLHYADVRPEDYVPDYAGGKSRVDFLLRESGVIVETKMTRDRLRDRQVGEELTIDWKRYERHPDCRAILAVVYDSGRYLSNAAGLERDLSQTHNEPATRVIVVR